jgi:hypothetical protein
MSDIDYVALTEHLAREARKHNLPNLSLSLSSTGNTMLLPVMASSWFGTEHFTGHGNTPAEAVADLRSKIKIKADELLEKSRQLGLLK